MNTMRFILAATLFATTALHAQVVADGATNTLANVTNTFTGDVTVSTNGSFTLLALSDNALLTNSVNGIIGRNATAKSNEVQLTSPTARWRMGGSLFIGSNGSLSRLIISNGGWVENVSARLSFAGAVGNQTVSSNNFALITGAGSVWSNRNDLDVGQSGRDNRMVVSDGGRVVSLTGSVGENGGASNNLVLVTGNGSIWSNSMNLRVGVQGSSNRLVVEAGGRVHAGSGTIGDFSSGSNNQVVVTGPSSLWTNAFAFIVGNQAGLNELVVSAGGALWSAGGVVGNNFAADNRAIVTGPGSAWTIPGTLTIGSSGARNALIASDGATVLATNLVIGANTASAGNRLTVDGGTLRVTNVSVTGTLDVRRGTNVLNAGLVEADRLLVTNSQGGFVFNGGTLSARSTTINNGQSFHVGNGVDRATLVLAGSGSHSFAPGGLHIFGNALLTGNGSVSGNTLLFLDSTLSPGASIGTLAFSSSPQLSGTTLMEISRTGTVLTNDRVTVTGTITYNGSLVVTNIGPTALAPGDRFPLFAAGTYAGGFGSLALPPLNPGLAWTNKLLVDGSIEVVGLIVQTLPAAIASNTATLNGVVNPGGNNATAWFEWGTTTNYGNFTAPQALGSGLNPTNFSQFLAGLAGGVAYHFRAVASNSFGLSFGSDQSFMPPAFVDIGAGLPGIDSAHTTILVGTSGSAAWGDYDNDGRLDVLLAGNEICQIWRNSGAGLTLSTNFTLSLSACSVAWGDYDNDGRLDFLAAGGTGGLPTVGVTKVFHNTESGFIDGNTNVDALLLGTYAGAAAWGDFDNDGLLEILLTGIGIATDALWRNVGNGWSNINSGLPAPDNSCATWGDYDNDGRLDVLLNGGLPPVWRNVGGAFTNSGVGPPAIRRGSVAWGDYDNDGHLDMLLTGAQLADGIGAISQIWRNTGHDFTNINADLPAVFRSAAAWGDYDNDGRLDFVLTGTTNADASGSIAQIWRNTGAGFTNINAGLPGVSCSSVAWGDYDNDGRLDILITGTNAILGRISKIWRNQTPTQNAPPSAPVGLTATVLGSQVMLSWDAASDGQTPASGLSYNVRIGSTPGASDIMGPMAGETGFRRLPQMGNANGRLFALFNTASSQPYYWSVQAVDTAFAGGRFAFEQSFSVTNALLLASVNGEPVGPLRVPGDQNSDGIVSQSELAAVLENLNGDGILTEADLDLVLSYYSPNSPFLQLTNVAGLGGTNVTFALTDDPVAGAFGVEYTTNFADWHFLGPATPRYLFTDTNAPAVPQRHYRLRRP
ncbi:MAG TPA: FG-GAP-like repeat-containing protein [Candidatus Paceibacterota bacterium]|nr:FG-GAP-like repeat-containing protein [Verrucomicrobiota bacterium]HSA10978.1 FG-GAP-like repeat-containing protein [Candidatus Paceibacterota bacterium]